MSDPADVAAELEEMERAAAAQVRRPVARRTGLCLYCGEPTPLSAAYCDADCREGYETEATIRARQGSRR